MNSEISVKNPTLLQTPILTHLHEKNHFCCGLLLFLPLRKVARNAFCKGSYLAPSVDVQNLWSVQHHTR